jgi:hypothetical protein
MVKDNDLKRAYEKTNYMLLPKVCYGCKRLILDRTELEMMFYEGECPRCSHSYGEYIHGR